MNLPQCVDAETLIVEALVTPLGHFYITQIWDNRQP